MPMPPPKGGGGGGRRRVVEPAARDDVVPMTTQLFALGTKHASNTVTLQERLLHDQLVLIRHGERQDHVDRAWKGNSLLPLYDPPLSNNGRKQSFETALKYYTLRQEKKVEQRIQGTFSTILVSPFHRCLETALIVNIVAFQGSLAMFVDPQLSDWQQQKVFRVAPTLGGHYAFQETGEARKPAGNAGNDHENADQRFPVVFKPQREALRTALAPFFEARAGELESLMESYKVTADVAAAWLTHLDVWLANHTALPVWTSEGTETAIAAQILRKEEEQQQHQHGRKAAGRPAQKGKKSAGNSGKASSTPADGADALFTQCGVPHPEGKADLQRRCQQVEHTHFLRSEASLRQVPPLVQASVAKEQKERLPKYFQVFDARPEASRASAGPPALLPPMHVMVITHADVVAGMVDVCCPRHLGDASGKSVPYCSVTVLMRHNNYYRIPPAEERPAVGGGGGSSSSTARGRGKPQQQRGGRGQKPLSTTVPPRGAAAASEELSVDWQVEMVGSTDLLVTTRVLLQFC